MNEQQIYAKLEEIFMDVFDLDEVDLFEDTTADDIDEWDSLEHINLIEAVEKEFGMKFKMGEVSTMKNVGEMVKIIKSRI
ncbi:MAG TPA: acyl carrier protein [Ruminococcus sp.]|nr:acyl carrier protein [Ruminococcus sp.]HCR73594.1 acyl carrier protein [Ruminococcus sp.]